MSNRDRLIASEQDALRYACDNLRQEAGSLRQHGPLLAALLAIPSLETALTKDPEAYQNVKEFPANWAQRAEALDRAAKGIEDLYLERRLEEARAVTPERFRP